MEEFPKSEQEYYCLDSVAHWNYCVSRTSGYDISVESEEGSKVSCGTMELSGKLTQADNIYSFDCEAVGRYVMLSGDGNEILLTEMVVGIAAGKFNQVSCIKSCFILTFPLSCLFLCYSNVEEYKSSGV
eukprot:sb/3475294/